MKLILKLSLFYLYTTLALPSYGQGLKCLHLPQLFEVYLKNHYSQKKLSDEIKMRSVDQFVKLIDPSKSSLLRSDVQKIQEEVSNVFKTMQTDNCTGLDNVAAIILNRAKENEKYVREFLAKDFKLDESVEYIADSKKRNFPANEEEKQDNLRKMIHFQMSNYLLTDLKMPEAKKQLVHSYELGVKRLAEKKHENYIETLAEAFAAALDPHSSFLTQDDLENFQIHMQLSLEGIGATLSSQNGFTVIESLVPGGSADRSKLLQAKDKIIAVTQEAATPVSVIDMDLRDVVKMIRGKKGTKVKLTIIRQAETTKTFDATIVRDKIDIKDQAAKITYETVKKNEKDLSIGMIELPSFYGGSGKGSRSCSADVGVLLTEAKKKNVSGIVLDLSKNGGGLLEEAVKISGLFIRKGNVVATKDSRAKVQVLSDDGEPVTYSGPLIVITSRYSASASEILAGVLKDYKRAIIVGADHTFGKGSVQALSDLPMGMGAMKVTTGMYFLPDGESTQQSGVAADIVVPSLLNSEDVGEKALDNSLAPQAIDAFISKESNPADPKDHWNEVNEATVKKLRELSKERVAKDPKFAEIQKTIKEIEENKSVIRLSDIRKKSKAEKKKEKTKKKSSKDSSGSDNTDEANQPLLREGVNILTDYVAMPGE